MRTVCDFMLVFRVLCMKTDGHSTALVTAQIAKEIDISGKEIEKLFGKLSEDVLKLQ